MADLRECDRSINGHRWFKIDDPATNWMPHRVFADRDVRECDHCHARRYRGLNSWGETEATWYDYPDGWKSRWDGVGGDRPDGNELRRIMLLG